MAYFKTIQGIVALILAALLVAGGWVLVGKYRANMAELDSLRTYKVQVETRQQVEAELRSEFANLQQQADNQKTGQDTYRVIVQQKTDEIANEDPATADFFHTPIPERLRNADRQLRIERQLGAGSPGRDRPQ